MPDITDDDQPDADSDADAEATVRTEVRLPVGFAERLEREYPEAITRAEAVRMAAARGLADRETELTEDRLVRAIGRALAEHGPSEQS